MNPAALKALALWFEQQGGRDGPFRIGPGLGRIEVIAPFWPTDRRIAFERDALPGVLMANDATFPRFRHENDGIFVGYQHQAMLGIYVNSLELLPWEGEVYKFPALIELLTKTFPGAAHGVSGIAVTRARMFPLQHEEKSVLAIETVMTVTGQFEVGRFVEQDTERVPAGPDGAGWDPGGVVQAPGGGVGIPLVGPPFPGVEVDL